MKVVPNSIIPQLFGFPHEFPSSIRCHTQNAVEALNGDADLAGRDLGDSAEAWHLFSRHLGPKFWPRTATDPLTNWVNLPTGYVKIANWNMAIEIVDFPMKVDPSTAMLVITRG